MKIISRYIFGKFWGPFFSGLGIFAVLVFLADLFDHLNYFMKSSAAPAVIARYMALNAGFWTLTVVPVAALLATLFLLSDMVHKGEWTAAMASGQRPLKLLEPIIFCAVIVAAGNFALSETLSPKLHQKASAIFERDIKGKKDWDGQEQRDITVMAGENIFVSAKTFKPKEGKMLRMVMDVQDGGEVKMQADAKSAYWSYGKKRWVFENGIIRKFSRGKIASEKEFKSFISKIDIPPSDLMTEKTSPESLSIRDIVKRIKRFKKIGAPVYREKVYLHSKISAPFYAVIICLLGMPFALIVKKAGKMLHFGAAIAIAFLFWWVSSVCQSAGIAGMMPPWLCAWAPVFIFGAASLFALRLAEK
ncbi:MAG: LptF/LptG family permease [Elusimicrobia bacterium]|nr:LptF/LptG family permease [Elusimicrobiota bacterium]